jgi:SagB-type dehydrogenase family enzyme
MTDDSCGYFLESLGVVSAQALLRASAEDPEFSPPRRPATCRGLVIVILEDGLIVEGTPERQFFQGTSATQFLPRLLEGCDGTRDAESLARYCSARRSDVEAALALLYARGVIEEGSGYRVADEMDVFLSRAVSFTAANSNGSEARARLELSTVAIVGPSSISGQLRKLILQSGVGECRVFGDPLELPTTTSERPLGRSTLVIGVDVGSAEVIDTYSRENGIPWFWVSREQCEMGPFFQGDSSACWSCAYSFGVGSLAPSRTRFADGLHSALDDVFISLTVGNIVHFLSRIADVPALRSVFRFTGSLTPSASFVPKRSICPLCSPLPGDDSDVTVGSRAALRYEQFVEAAPFELLNPSAHLARYDPRNVALQHMNKDFSTAAAIRRAEVSSVNISVKHDQSVAHVDLAQIEWIAERVVGIRLRTDSKLQRWTPTGGNLGSVALYWVATGSRDELECGIYYYDSSNYSFQAVGDKDDVDSLLSALGTPEREPPCGYIVLTAGLQRVAKKYGAFAYRLVYLDSGCAVAQLKLVADSIGVKVEARTRWDDDLLGELLCADPLAEPVTAVLSVGMK